MDDKNCFKQFTDCYKNQLKSIDISINNSCDESCVDILITSLSQMYKLIDLKIIHNESYYTNKIIINNLCKLVLIVVDLRGCH